MNCQSCGMPMEKPEDHGGGNPQNQFCKYCTDEQGNLLPRETVRKKMIDFYIQKQGKTQEEAERAADQLMAAMPAWKGEPATPAEPQPEAGRPLDETTPPAEEPKPEEVTPEPQTTPEAAPESTSVPTPATEPSTPESTTPPAQPTEPVAKTTPEPTTEKPTELTKPEGETSTE